MRRFELHRYEDVSGVSGTGVVAEGVAFSEGGPVALRWNSEWPTSVVFHDRGVESLEAVHGHNGRTRIIWLDGADDEYGYPPSPNCYDDDCRTSACQSPAMCYPCRTTLSSEFTAKTVEMGAPLPPIVYRCPTCLGLATYKLGVNCARCTSCRTVFELQFR